MNFDVLRYLGNDHHNQKKNICLVLEAFSSTFVILLASSFSLHPFAGNHPSALLRISYE